MKYECMNRVISTWCGSLMKTRSNIWRLLWRGGRGTKDFFIQTVEIP
jgi:hypothetical protein